MQPTPPFGPFLCPALNVGDEKDEEHSSPSCPPPPPPPPYLQQLHNGRTWRQMALVLAAATVAVGRGRLNSNQPHGCPSLPAPAYVVRTHLRNNDELALLGVTRGSPLPIWSNIEQSSSPHQPHHHRSIIRQTACLPHAIAASCAVADTRDVNAHLAPDDAAAALLLSPSPSLSSSSIRIG